MNKSKHTSFRIENASFLQNGKEVNAFFCFVLPLNTFFLLVVHNDLILVPAIQSPPDANDKDWLYILRPKPESRDLSEVNRIFYR